MILPFTESAPWLFIAVYVMASLSLSITMTAIYTMASESVDYHEWLFGNRQEGLLAAGIAFAIKVGMALGSAAVAYGLAIGGYLPDQASEQASQTMSWLYYGIPLGVFGLQLLCAQFYPMDEMRESMRVAAEATS